jgi:periplasmic protein TonB
MTAWSMPAPLPPPRGDAPRWVLCALAIVLLHAGAMIAAVTWQAPVELAKPPPPAIMIDLAPDPVVQPVSPPPPPPEPKPPPPPPEPAVTLPPPRPLPPKPRPVQRRVEPPPKAAIAPLRPAVTPPPAAAPVAPQAPPPVVTQPSPNVVADFQRAMLLHLERAKRYPREAQLRREQGTVYLRFRMDRSGRVLSAVIDRSSGYPDLDAEVLDMINRAQPLPPIPPEIAQSQLELVAPVRFSLR